MERRDAIQFATETLSEALETCENEDVSFHIREALQSLEGER